MAGVLPSESYQRSCYNCAYYKWEQPVDRNSIKQCAKCKILMYCSWQCQREHWENVHKQHCKYISKLKIKPKSVHVEASCPDCKLEVETGWVEMCSPENPVLGCHIGQTDYGFGLPLSLGEMTGKFLTKGEATVSLMLRILCKMKLIKHAAWVVNTKSSEEMCNMLGQARLNFWTMAYMFANPGPVLDEAAACASKPILDIDQLMEKTDKLLIAANFKEENKFRPWDTLKLLASFLLWTNFEVVKNAAECLGLSEMSEDLQKIRLTSDQHSVLWQKILDTLHGKMVPYMTLVEVLCGGTQGQKCYGCLKETTVSNVCLIGGAGSTESCDQVSLLIFGRVRAVLCDDNECSQEGMGEVLEHDVVLNNLYKRKGGVAIRCDYCGLPGAWNKGHRCSRCLTEVYCGDECRDKDWVVHKLVCREGEDERKRKGGQQARKKQGKDRVRHFYRKLDES